MIKDDVIFGATSSDLVPINKIELAARLGDRIDLNCDLINHHIKLYNEYSAYRYAYVKVPYKFENGLCCIGDAKINSLALSKVLKDVSFVYLFAVTSGVGVDKHISKATIQNTAESYLIDGIASAGIEGYADYIYETVFAGLDVTKRFSPGYADFSIEFQKYLLERLSAEHILGIKLSNDYLMIPAKSITAVVGVK